MESNGPIAGVVLAGGRGSRLGIPKADLQFMGEPLLIRVVRLLQQVTASVIVVAAPGQAVELPGREAIQILHDDAPYQGPLAALHAALGSIAANIAVVVACDMPFLSPQILRLQIDLLGSHDAVVPRVDGRAQTLHGVYRSSIAGLAGELVAKGERRLGALLEVLDVRYLREAEWSALCPDGSTFFNINSPHDLALATAMAGSSRS